MNGCADGLCWEQDDTADDRGLACAMLDHCAVLCTRGGKLHHLLLLLLLLLRNESRHGMLLLLTESRHGSMKLVLPLGRKQCRTAILLLALLKLALLKLALEQERGN